MALPVAVPVAIAVGQGLLDYFGKKKQAKANRKAALANLAIMYDDLNARARQEQAAASQQRQAVQQDAAHLRAETTVGAASSNVAGASVTALLNDITAQELNATGTIDQNLENTLDQIQRNKRGARAQAESQIAGVPQPSLAGAGLGIGVGVFDAFQRYR